MNTARPVSFFSTLSKRLGIPGYRILGALFAFGPGFGFSPCAQSEYEIPSWTVDGGGDESEGGRFGLSGTIGQPDAGTTMSGRYVLDGGFWERSPEGVAPSRTPTPTAVSTPTPTFTALPSDCDSGYYVLDSMGGRHPVGSPPSITGPVFFGWDIARDMERASCRIGGATVEDLVLLDGYGATHFVANASCNLMQDFYFYDRMEEFPQGRAVDMEISADRKGVWVLTDYGGIYRAGSAQPESEPSLIPGTVIENLFGFDIPIDPNLRVDGFPNPGGASLRAVSLVVIDSDSDNQPEGFIVLDSQGGRRHLKPDGTDFAADSFPGAAPNSPNLLLDPDAYAWPLFSGLDIARDMELHPSQQGAVILDGWGGVHPVPVNIESNPVYFATNRISNLDNTPRYMVGMPYITMGFDDPITEVEEDARDVFGSDAASIFKDLEFSSCDAGFYVLDRFGAVFAFGTAREDAASILPRFEGAPYFFPLLLAQDMEVFVNN
jgi:hypothetical protein